MWYICHSLFNVKNIFFINNVCWENETALCFCALSDGSAIAQLWLLCSISVISISGANWIGFRLSWHLLCSLVAQGVSSELLLDVRVQPTYREVEQQCPKQDGFQQKKTWCTDALWARKENSQSVRQRQREGDSLMMRCVDADWKMIPQNPVRVCTTRCLTGRIEFMFL